MKRGGGWRSITLVLFALWFTLVHSQTEGFHGTTTAGGAAAGEGAVEYDPNGEMIFQLDTTSFRKAIDSKDTDMIKRMIESGIDPNGLGHDRRSHLQYAVDKGNLEATKLLVENGAKVNFQSEEPWTPLSIAATLGHYEIAKYLLEKGANPNKPKGIPGAEPIHRASRAKIAKKEKSAMIHLLIDAGANPLVLDDEGRTILFILSYIEENDDLFKRLVLKGANLEVVDAFGWNVVHHVLQTNNFELLKFLIEQGAPIHTPNPTTLWTPLHRAAENGKISAVKLLLEVGADPNKKTKSNWTALHFACNRYLHPQNAPNEEGYLEIISNLLDHGAIVDERDSSRRTPLLYAIYSGFFKITKFLLEKGADLMVVEKDGKNAAYFAVESKNFDLFKFVVEKGVDYKTADKYGISPLKRAREMQLDEFVKYVQPFGP